MSYHPKRIRLEVIRDLLQEIDSEGKVTLRLLHNSSACRMKLGRLKKYLSFFAEKKLIRIIEVASLNNTKKYYAISVGGREALAIINEIFDVMSGMELI